MQRLTPLVILLLIVGYGIYNAAYRSKKLPTVEKNTPYRQHTQVHRETHLTEELSRIKSDTYLKQYIMDVINHGSTQLHFKKDEVMEAGFAPKEDAEKIACYVMTFSGRKCDKPYPADAVGFYTSICGGCHGNDGKGLDGTYPDLSRNPLLGIQQREAFLRSKVAP